MTRKLVKENRIPVKIKINQWKRISIILG
jgi:hypothetical protein